jgi:hypothetical protein
MLWSRPHGCIWRVVTAVLTATHAHLDALVSATRPQLVFECAHECVAPGGAAVDSAADVDTELGFA